MNLLREHWVLTLATSPAPGSEALGPYTTPLFYAVGPNEVAGAPVLVFASRPDTCHGQHLGSGPTWAAAAVYLETRDVGVLRGVQLRGEVSRLELWSPARQAALRASYLAEHPIAAERLGPGAREGLYGLVVRWAKMTDNRLGFGQKLMWSFTGDLPERPEAPPGKFLPED